MFVCMFNFRGRRKLWTLRCEITLLMIHIREQMVRILILSIVKKNSSLALALCNSISTRILQSRTKRHTTFSFPYPHLSLGIVDRDNRNESSAHAITSVQTSI